MLLPREKEQNQKVLNDSQEIMFVSFRSFMQNTSYGFASVELRTQVT